MVRGAMFFLMVWVAVAAGISAFRSMTGAEKWSLVKTASYGAITALIACSVIGLMVVIF